MDSQIDGKDTTIFYLTSIVSSIFIGEMGFYLKNRWIIGFSFLILVFILGFRNMSGTDDPQYAIIYDQIKQWGWIGDFARTSREPGFSFFYWLIQRFSSNYFVAQFIASLLPMTLFMYVIIKEDRRIIPFAFLIYFIPFIYFHMLAVSLVRLFIAMSIVFFSLSELYKGKTKKYVLGVLIATLFHYSAAIMFVFSIFSSNNKKLKQRPKLMYFSTLIYVISIMFLITYITPHMSDRYSKYTEMGTVAFDLRQFDALPFLLFAIFFRRYIPDTEKHVYRINTIILSYSIVISMLSGLLGISRTIFYFNLSLCFLFSYWIRYSPNNGFRILLSFMLIFYGYLYFFLSHVLNPIHHYYLYPYHNLFFDI